MASFKGIFTGKPYISWENLWFPVDFPLNQSIEENPLETHHVFTGGILPLLQGLELGSQVGQLFPQVLHGNAQHL